MKQIIYSFTTLVLLLLLGAGSGCTHVPTHAPSGKIAFTSDREGAPSIYIMSPDGSNPIKLGSWFGIPNTFCWAPDGERIAFIDGDGWLCLVTADDGSLSKLAEIPSYSISWSPDGGKIAAGCFDYDIYAIGIGTGELQNLTNTPDIVESLPSWSPDSQKIVFTTSGPHPTGKNICIMDTDGSNVINLTNTPDIDDYLAIWSPQ